MQKEYKIYDRHPNVYKLLRIPQKSPVHSKILGGIYTGFFHFLPHDTMLAWYMLSLCVCLSVTCQHCITSGSAMAEGPRDALVSMEKLAIDERP